MRNDTSKTSDVLTDEVRKELIDEVSREVRKVIHEENGVKVKSPSHQKAESNTRPEAAPGLHWRIRCLYFAIALLLFVFIYCCIVGLFLFMAWIELVATYGSVCGNETASFLFWAQMQASFGSYLPFEIQVPEAPAECTPIWFEQSKRL